MAFPFELRFWVSDRPYQGTHLNRILDLILQPDEANGTTLYILCKNGHDGQLSNNVTNTVWYAIIGKPSNLI